MKPSFVQPLLNILCQGLPETRSAMLVVIEGEGQSISMLATWPDKLEITDDYSQVIKYALANHTQVSIENVRSGDDVGVFDYHAVPVFNRQVMLGILIFKVTHSTRERHDEIIKFLQQGVQCLTLESFLDEQNNGFYITVIRLLVTCFQQKTYREALIALASELTLSLNCDRVALGEFKGQHSKLIALSNSAQFDGRSNLMQAIADAMDEAIEQDSLIVFPNAQAIHVQRAHQELARKFGSGSLLTLPMVEDDSFFGAVTLLRSEEKPFDAETVRLCEQAMALVAPFLMLKKADEQSLAAIVMTKTGRWFAGLLGVKHLKMKLSVTGLLCLLLSAALINSDYHVTADAVLEGKMQRAVASPVSGYLMSASVRAGDTVRKGELMASLDDAELQLELNKLNGELQKYRREYREALSTNDLVKVRVISAQIDQAAAEMALTQQQLQKIALTAPFDSVVIEGDLSQMLGSPVERGDILFKIAPLEGYRIILKVDESLISFVRPGQSGMLALSGIPDRMFKLTIQKITAVAKAEDKQNIFRVEASLDNAPDLLRPGMEGIGKINAGRKSLLWIWTHEVGNWLRLWLWSWWF